MKLSGFTMARNADLLYYPIAESIASALPIVDEFVVALGKGDEADRSREKIEALSSPKITIIDTEWDTIAFPNGTEHAHQTDIAKEACSGDWLLYLQADEVIHEEDHSSILSRCSELLGDDEVEGLLFNYLHFWGDYQHVHRSHGWYRREIRIVRNDPEIHSWESAQSFRRIPEFDGRSYRQQVGTQKLHVAQLDARIFHYGWVRPPEFMLRKQRAFDTNHHGREEAERRHGTDNGAHAYGPLGRIPLYDGSHPEVMQERIEAFDWGHVLDYGTKLGRLDRALHKHERLRYRLLSGLERMVNRGEEIGGFRNYILIDR